jgi:hypothetical protein
MDLMRDPHGRPVAVAQQQRKLDRIHLVSFDSISWSADRFHRFLLICCAADEFTASDPSPQNDGSYLAWLKHGTGACEASRPFGPSPSQRNGRRNGHLRLPG